MCEGQPTRPANILNIVAINQGHQPLTMTAPEPAALEAREFAARRDQGHVVIDARSSLLFGSGHIPGSYNMGVGSPEFEQRIGWVAPADVPLLLVAGSDAEAREAAHKMAFLGLDQRIEGYLTGGGVGAWAAAGEPIATLPQISVHALARELGNGNGLKVLDVREPEEYDLGHIAGALTMSYKTLRQDLDQLDVVPDDHLAVVCAQGARSSTACSVLLINEFRHLRNVAGGMNAWRAADLPTVDSRSGPVVDRGAHQ